MAVHRIEAPELGTMWLVTGYEEARAALVDPRLSRDARNAPEWLRRQVEQNQAETSLGRNMLDSDPPEHTRLRAAVKRAFTPRRVEGMRPRIEQITGELLDAMARSMDIGTAGEVDLIDALAFPLPVTVICELLGLPVDDRAEFRSWTAHLVLREDERSHAAGKAMRAYLENFVAHTEVWDSAEAEQPDLTRALLRGGQLRHDELVSMLMLLLIAGHETTVNLIGSAMNALFGHPDQLDLLRRRPESVEQAVEELLRFDGPLQSALPRVAVADLTIGDTRIPAGGVVGIALPAVNRDPAVFDDPDRLDITRADVPHLAFGHGTHFCLGASLARLEAQVAIGALVARFPGIRLAVPAEQLRWREGIIRGLVRLPVRL